VSYPVTTRAIQIDREWRDLQDLSTVTGCVTHGIRSNSSTCRHAVSLGLFVYHPFGPQCNRPCVWTPMLGGKKRQLKYPGAAGYSGGAWFRMTPRLDFRSGYTVGTAVPALLGPRPSAIQIAQKNVRFSRWRRVSSHRPCCRRRRWAALRFGRRSDYTATTAPSAFLRP
jgi:hypothetical protein